MVEVRPADHEVVLDVVLHVVVTRQLPRPVGQGEPERGDAEGDDDRGEHHRLRERVGHRPLAQADDRGAAGRAGGDEEDEVDAVAQHDEADEDAGEAPLEDERRAAGDEHDDGRDEGEVGAQRTPTSLGAGCTSPFSSPCLSMPPPRLRSTSSERPTTTR